MSFYGEMEDLYSYISPENLPNLSVVLMLYRWYKHIAR